MNIDQAHKLASGVVYRPIDIADMELLLIKAFDNEYSEYVAEAGENLPMGVHRIVKDSDTHLLYVHANLDMVRVADIIVVDGKPRIVDAIYAWV